MIRGAFSLNPLRQPTALFHVCLVLHGQDMCSCKQTWIHTHALFLSFSLSLSLCFSVPPRSFHQTSGLGRWRGWASERSSYSCIFVLQLIKFQTASPGQNAAPHGSRGCQMHFQDGRGAAVGDGRRRASIFGEPHSGEERSRVGEGDPGRVTLAHPA